MTKDTETPLTERERRFVEAYLGDAAGNATKAAELAGYSATSARRIGTRLSSKDHIQQAIDVRAQRDPAVWTRQQRQQFWTRIANDPETPIRERLKASELLGRSQGDFIERRLLRLEGNGGRRSLEDILEEVNALEEPQRRSPPVVEPMTVPVSEW
ncbi:MAG: terminase small subunit [Vicinamibacterales bacterium]